MQWTLLAQDPDPATMGKIIMAGIAILTGVNVFLAIYQKINPKKAPGQEYVTLSGLNELKQELVGQIGSTRRKQELLEEQHKRFVSREELDGRWETMFGAMTQRLTEHGTMVHELSDYIHKMDDRQHDIGLLVERGFSELKTNDAVMKVEIKQIKERLRHRRGDYEDDSGDGSDDQLPRTQ